jgi:hypothetical protein
MFRYAAIYGSIAGVVIIAILGTVLTVWGEREFATSMTLGYLVMLVILSLLFIGVKRYRDVELGGTIRFGRAFGLGAAIAAIAGVFYALSWEVVLAVTDFAFVEQYSAAMADQARGLPDAERAAKLAEVESFKAMYRNPLFRLPMTFVEIFPVGLVVALVSALLLKNPKVLPARRAT